MNVKKHTIAYATALIAATVTMPTNAQGLNAYAGLNLGWNATAIETKTSTNVDLGTGGGTALINEKVDFAASGAAFGGVAGLKFPISTGYLAIEANIADSSAEAESEAKIDGTTISASSITSDLSYGLTGILATEIASKTHLYGLLGYQMTDFEAQYTDRDTATNDIVKGKMDDSFGGARVGAGIETAVTSALSVRLEWSQTYYSEEEFEFETTTSSDPATIEYEPVETRVTLGIIGHF